MSSIFISYRRNDIERLQPLLNALDAKGIDYWLDTRDVEAFENFSLTIGGALADARLFLAWYSADYPESKACQWEFTAAFLTAQKDSDPFQRLIVINPEEGEDHLLLPQEVRGQNIRSAPAVDDQAGFATLADEIEKQLAKVSEPFGQIQAGEIPPCYGRRLTHSPSFVGRLKEFWRIHWALHNGSDKTITAAAPVHMVQLTGMGGMGKSMFTEEYACRYGWAYPGGVFWLNAYGADGNAPESIESFSALRHTQLDQIAGNLGIDTSLLENPQQVADSIRRKLEKNGHPYLWVVDDLPSGLENLTEFEEWLAPDTAHGKTLITTRTTAYEKRGVSIPFDILDRESAYELLTRKKKLDDPAEEDAARGIITDLGGHPLALELAAANMEAYAGMTTFAEYRDQLASPDEDTLEMAKEFVGMLPNGHEASIAATMRHSLQQLDEDGLDFLCLASQLAAAPIPASLVAETFSIADEIEEKEAIRKAGWAFKQTEKHSLSYSVESSQGLRIVHALVRRVIRFEAGNESRCFKLKAAVVERLNVVLDEVGDIRSHQKLEQQVLHARELVKALTTEDEALLASWVAHHDHVRGDYSYASLLNSAVLKFRKEFFGLNHPQTLNSTNNLGTNLLSMGHYNEARDIFERTLACSKKTLGLDHSITLLHMNNLAEVLRNMKEYSEARKLLRETLERSTNTLGKGDAQTIATMNNLALTLCSMQEYGEAKDLMEEVLISFKEAFGNEHPDTLSAIHNLALIHLNLQNYSRVKTLLEPVLERCKIVHGIHHPDTTCSAWNLFYALVKLEDKNTAIFVFKDCLHWLLTDGLDLQSEVHRNIRDMLPEYVKV